MGSDSQWIDVDEDDVNAALRYAVVIEWSPEDEAFVVSVPDIPDLHTHGATREEAAAMGDDAIALWIAGARATGVAAPPPAFSALRAGSPHRFDAPHIQAIRHRLNVSQHIFADLLNVSVGTVRAWEQGARTPDGASVRLLAIAEHQPDVLLSATALASRRG